MHSKEFSSKDKSQVFELFEKVFHRKMTNEFWEWRFTFFDEPIRYSMMENDLLVGYYNVHPIPIKGYSEFDKILFSMTTMSHPDYRGNKIFEKLSRVIYERAIKKNYKMLIVFPNKISAPIFFEKLGWKNLGKNIEIKKDIEVGGKNIKLKFKIKEISSFFEIGDLLWEKYEKFYKFMFPRTSNYLKWRFELSPKQKYQNYEYENFSFFVVENNNQVIAYFVLKKFGLNKVHLVDYFGDLSYDTMENIISFGINYTKNQNYKYFSLWKNDHLENLNLEKIFNENSFDEITCESFFGVRSLVPKIQTFERKDWFLTMSDSDVY